MHIIENDILKIEINPKGAELTSVFSKTHRLDYLWNGDPNFWGKHSPILFPIVGTLKDDTYYYQNKSYTLSRHGFAREMHFELSGRSTDSISFTLRSSTETLAKYPFEFSLEVVYVLEKNRIKLQYNVSNTGNHEMYFSIGGHPAFNVPIDNNSLFEDYYVEFGQTETAGRWPISRQGLIEALPVGLLNGTTTLPITHDLFSGDALVFKYLNSRSLQLKSHTSPHGIEFNYEGFPFLGIWSGKNGSFVCIEPWCGIADSVSGSQQLVEKEGINMITPGQVFNREWFVEIF